jgi:hypothetical protein
MDLKIPIRDDDGRPLLRTFAEMTEALQKAGVPQSARITIGTGEFALPNGADTLIWLSVKTRRKPAQIVQLPATSKFYATTSDGTRQSFPAMRLNGARLFSDGSAQLADGSFLHAIDLKPPALPSQIPDPDLDIVLRTIRICHLVEGCYREVAPNILPGLQILDFALLRMVQPRLPPLNVIVQRLWESGLKVSRQKIEGALLAAGLRVPRSGRQSIK